LPIACAGYRQAHGKSGYFAVGYLSADISRHLPNGIRVGRAIATAVRDKAVEKTAADGYAGHQNSYKR